jgi:hypothetical protein
LTTADQLATVVVSNRDNEEEAGMKRVLALLPVLLAFQVGVSPALAWTWPVEGPVLKKFSFDPEDPYAAGQHRGIDIGAPSGTPVAAPAGGTISFAGTVPGGGLTLAIRTLDGYSVTLVHLGAVAVGRGATVEEGSVVGSVGPSGDLEHAEPYLQLGIRIAADAQGYVDPLSLLPARSSPPTDAAGEPVEGSPAVPDAVGEEAPAATPPVSEAPTGSSGGPGAARRARSRKAAPESELPLPASHLADRVGREPSQRLRHAGTGRKWGGGKAPLGSHLGRRARAPQPAASAEVAGEASPAADDGARWLMPALAAAAAVLAGAGLAARRQLRDAGVADGSPAMLSQAAVASAEDAGRLRLGEEDDILLDGDLERVLLAQTQPFPDLNRNDDAAELVDVANDARRSARDLRRRGPHGCSRSHRRRRKPLSARLL